MMRAALCLALVIGAASAANAASPTLVSIKTPRGVTQEFILIKPEKPEASLILFAGGHGALGLTGASTMTWGSGNFLVRTRHKFAAHDFMVAVIDAPSDRSGKMNAEFRMSRAHASDIGAIAAFLKGQAAVPVWLVGTSMGTFSAAGGAIAAKPVDGLVLTSTVTRSKPEWKIASSHKHGVASMPLGAVTIPTLIVSHKNDGCEVTPAADAPKLKTALAKSKVEVVLLDGGSPPQSEPCQAKSQHGFLGIEDQAVGVIAKFVKANRTDF